MEKARDPIQEEWNPAELSASTSVFEISVKSDCNPHNSTADSELNFPFTGDGFEKSGEETAFFQAVPTDQTIAENVVASWEGPEEEVYRNKKDKKKGAGKKIPKIKKTKKSFKAEECDGTQLPNEMESLSINSDEIARAINEAEHSEEVKRTRNSLTKSMSAKSEINLSGNLNISGPPPILSPLNSTVVIQSEIVNRSFVDGIVTQESSSAELPSTSSLTNHDSSQYEADSSSSTLNRSGMPHGNSRTVHFDVPGGNEENQEPEPAKPKNDRKAAAPKRRRTPAAPRRTKTKGIQANIKVKAPRAAKEPKKANTDVKDKKEPKNKEGNESRKDVKKRAVNKIEQPPLKEVNNINNHTFDDNSVVPQKVPRIKNFLDIAGPSNINVSNMSKEGGDLSEPVSSNDLTLRGESTAGTASYNINIIKTSDDANQPIKISLPPQSSSKITNINVTVSNKDEPSARRRNAPTRNIKEEPNTPEKIDLTHSPVIKKEKYVSPPMKNNKSPAEKQKKPTPAKNKKEPNQNKNQQMPRRRTIECGYMSSSSGNSEDSESDSCSCSECDEDTDCSCSDCMGNSSDSSCSCGNCSESDSDSSSSCDCLHSHSRKGRR